MITKKLKKELTALIISLGYKVEIIKNKKIEVQFKHDTSPISVADKLVNDELKKFLAKNKFKNVISEEIINKPFSLRKEWDYYWVIDPIDGTKEFIKGNSDYTINIALCKNGSPIYGIVYAPALQDMYVAEKNMGAYKNSNKICIKQDFSRNLSVIASKSHINEKTNNFIRSLERDFNVDIKNIGSSLKICLIAEGKADVYPRFGPTMEWDTCAAQIILEEAGGKIFNESQKKLHYNKEQLGNPDFIASSGQINFDGFTSKL